MTPGVADSLVGVEDEKSTAASSEVIADGQASLTTTDHESFNVF
jgi:hypothetical protein